MRISDWSSDVCSSDLGLLEGLEAEVDLAVDVLFPAERLARVLRAFANEYPTVSLRLNVEALGAVVAMVLDGKAVAGISGPLAADVEEIERMSAGSARSEEHTSELQSLMRISYAVFCLQKKNKHK